ncbi:hypothetical protein KBI33_01430 [Candidatus Shapirobacteria bacterium]|nr:hypothetical protein [Candidatus Shapirobacteria bacterium]
MSIRVQKRDGRLEEFDVNKIRQGLAAAGATPAQVEAITKEVESWAKDNATKGFIRTVAIKEKVLSSLRLVNPQAATAFESYQKPAEG